MAALEAVEPALIHIYNYGAVRVLNVNPICIGHDQVMS